MPRTLVILFTEELADLLDAGVQLEQARCEFFTSVRPTSPSKAVAGTLREEIREGSKFSGALKKASPSFDDLYRNLVSAGEASGSLTDILRRLADSLKQLYELAAPGEHAR